MDAYDDGEVIMRILELFEGGWDTTKTQSTVITPNVVIRAEKIVDKNLTDLLSFTSAPGGARSVPTPDHYIPMLYSLALARKQEEVRFTYDQLVYGGISMRCFEIS